MVEVVVGDGKISYVVGKVGGQVLLRTGGSGKPVKNW